MKENSGSRSIVPPDAAGPPPGISLHARLQGHRGAVVTQAYDPTGAFLVTASNDCTARIWDTVSRKEIHVLRGHSDQVWSVAFSKDGKTVATASCDRTVKLWNRADARLLHTLEGHRDLVWNVVFSEQTLASSAGKEVFLWTVFGDGPRRPRILEGHLADIAALVFSPDDSMLASASYDHTIRLWNPSGGKLFHVLNGHRSAVCGLAFEGKRGILASAGNDRTIKIWDPAAGKLLHTLEGHTSGVEAVAFSADGSLLASKSYDDTIRLWGPGTWETVAIIPEPANHGWVTDLTFHPQKPQLAVSAGDNAHLWNIDPIRLGGGQPDPAAAGAFHQVSARIVLVGDSGAGKSGLAWRLVHDEFKEQSSTHGQQFWLLPSLSRVREDGARCEAVLWDFAGQPDYRLIHALFLKDAHVALVVFDATDRSALRNLEYWLRQLGVSPGAEAPSDKVCKIILVAARSDVGTTFLSPAEREAFCGRWKISAFSETSAKSGQGIAELKELIEKLIAWDERPAVVTTAAFKEIKSRVLELKQFSQTSAKTGEGIAKLKELIEKLIAWDECPAVVTTAALMEIKNRVLDLKQASGTASCVVAPEELLQQFPDRFADTGAVVTAATLLENHGYVKLLETAQGEPRILLAPELLNNLASSILLEARRSGRGLVEESFLFHQSPDPSPSSPFTRDLDGLPDAERRILLEAAAALFLERHFCYRWPDGPRRSFLVFPELVNETGSHLGEESRLETGETYSVSGAVENVYSSLVVLTGYTPNIKRHSLYRNEALFEIGLHNPKTPQLCGFRRHVHDDGDVDFTLLSSRHVDSASRMAFQLLFESFLSRHALDVTRYRTISCNSCGYPLDRALLKKKYKESSPFAFCGNCNQRLPLSAPAAQTGAAQDTADRSSSADHRAGLEAALLTVQTMIRSATGGTKKSCFISYAWDGPDHEEWVEFNLATDLLKAGVDVKLDRWFSRIGDKLTNLQELIQQSDHILVVGTPAYPLRASARNESGNVLAMEWEIIELLLRPPQKKRILLALAKGKEEDSFPARITDRVRADFTDPVKYESSLFELILAIYDNINLADPVISRLRRQLERPGRTNRLLNRPD